MDNETEESLNQEDLKDNQEMGEDVQDFQEQMASEEYNESGAVPYQRKPDSLFSLFQKVWKSPDSSKVANLDKFELGKPDINVRDAQYLSLLGETFKHPKFGDFFRNRSEIILATSASKKGWFTELFVSQKKFTQRQSSSVGGIGEPERKRWRMFNPEPNPPPNEQ